MSKQILFVDTNAENRFFMRRIIEHAGYRCHTAADHQAIEHAAGEFDLLLLTITDETAADSFSLVRQLKIQAETLTIIAVLHQQDSHLQEQAFLAGCDGHLAKPADIRQIQALLRDTLIESVTVQSEASLVAAD